MKDEINVSQKLESKLEYEEMTMDGETDDDPNTNNKDWVEFNDEYNLHALK